VEVRKEPIMKINSISRVIEGEGVQAGIPMLLVRTAGCNLKCSYCLATGSVLFSRKVSKPISRVSVGDKLLAWDEDNSKIVETEVKEVLTRLVDNTVEIRFEN
jgi:organic radical activating enzyme